MYKVLLNPYYFYITSECVMVKNAKHVHAKVSYLPLILYWIDRID